MKAIGEVFGFLIGTMFIIPIFALWPWVAVGIVVTGVAALTFSEWRASSRRRAASPRR